MGTVSAGENASAVGPGGARLRSGKESKILKSTERRPERWPP